MTNNKLKEGNSMSSVPEEQTICFMEFNNGERYTMLLNASEQCVLNAVSIARILPQHDIESFKVVLLYEKIDFKFLKGTEYLMDARYVPFKKIKVEMRGA